MLNDLTKGLTDYLKALEMINKLRLWKFVIFVGLISIVFGTVLIYLGYQILDTFSSSLNHLYPFEWGKAQVATVIKYLGVLILFISGIFFYKYLIFILFVPFLGPLSEKIEEHLTGRKAGYSILNIPRLIKDIFRGLRISIRLIYKELLWMILVFFFGMFPLFAPLVPVFIFIIQAFYAGYGNLDWALERYYNIGGRISFVSQNRLLTLGNGIAFVLLLSLPLIGFFLAPVLSVGAATISVIDKIESQNMTS